MLYCQWHVILIVTDVILSVTDVRDIVLSVTGIDYILIVTDAILSVTEVIQTVYTVSNKSYYDSSRLQYTDNDGCYTVSS